MLRQSLTPRMIPWWGGANCQAPASLQALGPTRAVTLNPTDLCPLEMTKEVIKFRTVPEVGGGRAADSASTVRHKPQDQIRACELLPSVLEFRVQCAKVGLGSQRDKLFINPAGVCCSIRLCRVR